MRLFLNLLLLFEEDSWLSWLSGQLCVYVCEWSFAAHSVQVFMCIHTYLNLIYSICDRIWEKGPLRANSEIAFLTLYNSGSTVATHLNFGTIILLSFCNTRKKSWAPPTSCLGVATARITRCQKTAVLYLSLAAYCSWTKGLLWILTLDLWSRRTNVHTNQVESPGLVCLGRGDDLKNGLKMRFARSGPFSQILSHIVRITYPPLLIHMQLDECMSRS